MADDVRLDTTKLEEMIREQPLVVGRWLSSVATEMVGDIKQGMLDSPATGNTYSRGSGRMHSASSPGNPPRPDIGTLINSVRQRNVGAYHRVIEAGPEYALYLEEGTERIAARPFIAPVFIDWRKKIARHAEENLFK